MVVEGYSLLACLLFAPNGKKPNPRGPRWVDFDWRRKRKEAPPVGRRRPPPPSAAEAVAQRAPPG